MIKYLEDTCSFTVLDVECFSGNNLFMVCRLYKAVSTPSFSSFKDSLEYSFNIQYSIFNSQYSMHIFPTLDVSTFATDLVCGFCIDFSLSSVYSLNIYFGIHFGMFFMTCGAGINIRLRFLVVIHNHANEENMQIRFSRHENIRIYIWHASVFLTCIYFWLPYVSEMQIYLSCIYFWRAYIFDMYIFLACISISHA